MVGWLVFTACQPLLGYLMLKSVIFKQLHTFKCYVVASLTKQSDVANIHVRVICSQWINVQIFSHEKNMCDRGFWSLSETPSSIVYETGPKRTYTWVGFYNKVFVYFFCYRIKWQVLRFFVTSTLRKKVTQVTNNNHNHS